ncbi:hypothetical protein I9W82_000070 [Candida metapsilosis]|uniref:Uncharacterized protein n=1 Tax=Candida metapsilosis TaxID=273372 RepID=A0A8H8DDI9_9ASCO|nr:hypothetical protein I9W82_000070 [Candida metapsilosis]
MINKNMNLHLKLNKMDFNQPSSVSTPSGLNSQPYTPIDQTLKTPIQAPGEYPFNPPPLHHQNSYNNQNTIQQPQPQPQPQQQQQQQQTQYNQSSSFYQNSQYAESDDILTDIDEPETANNNNNFSNSASNFNNASLKRPSFPMSNGMKNTSISNLSLNEMNLMNYNAQQQQQAQAQNQASNASIRSRSSSLNLRKQSLTRNNSNNWLHVGNIHSLRPRNSNASTVSLDCVPIQANLFNGGGFSNGASANSTPPQSAGIQTQYQSNYFPQQPISAGGNVQPQTTYFPPPNSQEYQNMNSMSAPFNLPPAPPPPFLQRSRSSTSGSGSGCGNGPSVPYHLNTESANAQALNSLNGRSSFNANGTSNTAGFSLDSPFEPNSHQFSQPSQSPQNWTAQPCAQQYQQFQQPQLQRQSSLSSQSSMQDDSVMDEARFNSNFNTNYVSLSEKKRDSLKLKRGMH